MRTTLLCAVVAAAALAPPSVACDPAQCFPDTTQVFGVGARGDATYELVPACDAVLDSRRTMMVRRDAASGDVSVVRGGPQPNAPVEMGAARGAVFVSTDDRRVARVREDDGSVEIFDSQLFGHFADDGEAVYWLDGRGGLFRATLDGPPSNVLAGPALSPPASYVAAAAGAVFAASRDSPVVYRVSAAAELEAFVTLPPISGAGVFGVAALAARGDKLAFAVRLARETAYFDADARAGGEARLVAVIDEGDPSPRVALTERGTLVACHGGATSQVLRITPEGVSALATDPCRRGFSATRREVVYLAIAVTEERATSVARVLVDP